MTKTAPRSSSRAFWDWFQRHEKRLWHVQGNADRWFDELQQALERYGKGLWIEVSDEERGVRDLIISAAGDEQLFSLVRTLVGAAPHLPRWRVVALKPARGFDFTYEEGPLRLDPRDLVFEPLEHPNDPRAIGLRVFYPSPGGNIETAVERIIEIGVGEERRARIGHIEVAPLPSDAAEYIALSELAEYLDWFERKVAASTDVH